MRLGDESRSSRLLVLAPVWLILGALIAWHALCVRDYLGIAGNLGLRGASESSTPLKAIYPGFAADAQTWVRHALALLEGGDIRLRWTTIDNAPFGREVHWNSGWAWSIAGAGKLDHLVTGLPLPQAVERMTLWLPGFMLWVCVIGFSWWTSGKGGLAAGIFVAVALAGHARFYEGFFPSYVDHHGLITVAVFALVLGTLFMGAGWWRTVGVPERLTVLPTSVDDLRRAAVFSGLGGAVGMWVGAASVIPTIAFVGFAGFFTVLVLGRKALKQGDRFDAMSWRLWGRAGAVGSLCFYILEYFPNHLGFRLEVNHPFYALAWLGAGELLADFSEWWLEGCRRSCLVWPRILLAALALMAAPLAIIIGGPGVFVVSDPFLSRLHNSYIQEFLPLGKSLGRLGWRTWLEITIFENIPLFVGLAFLLTRGRRSVFIFFITVVAILAQAMAWWQSRWLLNSTGPQVCLALGVLGIVTAHSRATFRWVAIVVAAIALYGVTAVRRIVLAREDIAAKKISPGDAVGALHRDIARVIRASQPQGEIVLLSSPNASTGIGYFGRFKTLGTLYWENNDGLKGAGRILSASPSGEAERLIRERKVTHIAILSEENFIAPYFQLLNPKSTADDLKQSLGYQLLVDKVVPYWLRALPYRVPDELKALNIEVLLLQVAFDQTPADALYNLALTKMELGQVDQAEKDLEQLTRSFPQLPLPWLRKAEIYGDRQQWERSADAAISGIKRMKPSEQPELFSAAAAKFYRLGHPAQAIAIYRAALSTGFDATLASYLAWILATNRSDHLRDGREALNWAQQALKAEPQSPTHLNALAAAYAESGQFSEAAEIARKALAQARSRNDTQAASVSESRLAAYLSGKPWRE